KGGNVSLSKEAPGLEKVHVGLGWDARSTDGQPFDLDASVLVCGDNGKVLSDQHFIFFNNKKDPSGAVEHLGDNLTGAGEGDDEVVILDLKSMPAEAKKAVFVVTIYDAESRKQNFGQVSNAFIRAVNASDNKEIARYDLSEDASLETAMVFAEVYNHNGDWKMKAIGQGYSGGLAGVARDFGVNVG
ncbi:MAG: TerD family protein, partial [Candidatus Competibacteraceae bacterium]|nr:TerD family protein [Candidatus Competibacteraceae bacterium]